jgi:hypothetical protein
VFGPPQRLASPNDVARGSWLYADWITELARQRGAWANIPPKRNRKAPICFGPYLYRARNLIERFFNKIKHCRRVATRYHKLAANYLAFVKLASIRIWLRSRPDGSWPPQGGTLANDRRHGSDAGASAAEASATHPFGLESGGQSGRATRGLPPLCTVGAAEFAPPASGRTALFSTAIEFVVFSSPLPDVADPVVVQLVSGFSLEGVVDCAAAGPMTNVPTRIAAAARSIFISIAENRLLNSI